MTYDIAIEDNAPDAVRASIVDMVVAYNNSKVGPGNGRALVVVLRNQEGEVCGGLSGATSRGWLFVDHLVVTEASRGQGLGRKLVSMAEREAIKRGCANAWLNTFEFQARGFYEKLGYERFGTLENYPIGFSRFFMQKSLARSVE
jgi:GNAT superfamily N-acetyltransferase